MTEYLSNIMKILIATPLRDSRINIEYVQELFKILSMKPPNYMIDINFRGGADIDRTKNELLSFFLGTPYDYVFLIEPTTTNFAQSFYKVASAYEKSEKVIPMIGIGAINPNPAYLFEQVNNIKRSCNIRNNLFDFDITPAFEKNKIPPGSAYSDALIREAQCNNGLVECSYLSTGFFMLSRKVLETIIEKNPEIKYSRNTEETYLPESLYNFFTSGIDADTKKYQTGDVTMCNMLRDLGALLFVDAKLQLGVKGYENFIGSYIENLMNRKGVVDDQNVEDKRVLPPIHRAPAVPEAPPISVPAQNVILKGEDPSGAANNGETKKKRKKRKKKKKR